MHAQHTSSNADIIIVVVVVVLFFIFLILMWISIDLDFGVCLKENFFTQKKEKGKKKERRIWILLLYLEGHGLGNLPSDGFF